MLRAVVADRHYPGSPALATVHHFIKGTHDARPEDIAAFMKSAGFCRLDERLYDKETLPDGLWYREADHVLAGDANASNFVRLPGSRQLIPIDLTLAH